MHCFLRKKKICHFIQGRTQSLLLCKISSKIRYNSYLCREFCTLLLLLLLLLLVVSVLLLVVLGLLLVVLAVLVLVLLLLAVLLLLLLVGLSREPFVEDINMEEAPPSRHNANALYHTPFSVLILLDVILPIT